MGIGSWFKHKLNYRSTYGPDDDYWYQAVGIPTISGVDVDESSALLHPDVLKCVKVIAETIAALPLNLYKQLSNGGKERADGHSLQRILHLRPNSEMTSFQFRETAMYHLLVWGNFYGEIQRARTGDIIAVWPMRPDRMEVKRGTSSLLEYHYTSTGQTEKKIFESEQILHIPGLGFNGVTGRSPIEMAREAIGLGKAASEFAARFFSNDATPPTFLKHPGKLSEQAKTSIKKSWIQAHGGLKHKFEPAVLEEGLDIKTIGMPMKDAQFLELRKFQRTEICGIYRVPPHMISDTEPSTSWGSGIEQQAIGFIVYTIQPWLIRLEQAYTIKLLTESEQLKYFIKHLLQGLLRGDSAARASYYNTLFNIGVFSQNDILALEDMNPIENGDKHYVAMNMAPISGEEPPPEPQPSTKNQGEEMSAEEKEELKNLRELKTTWKREKIDLEDAISDFRGEIAEFEARNKVLEVKSTVYKAEIEAKDIQVQSLMKDIEDRDVRIKNLYIALNNSIVQTDATRKQQVSSTFHKLLEDAVARIVRRESIAIRRALQSKELVKFEEYLDDFYRDLPDFASSTLHVPVNSYAQMVDSTGALNCIQQYVSEHIKDSRGEISQWVGVYIHDHTSEFKRNTEQIDDCLSLWADKRPEKAASVIQMYFATS